ncbi:MAG TPA: two-component regulator propeller domain-containing protein, partial [Bacteroidales bacterium]|nr:two-component regulator propeller domain-containing protein [Bacteroidales bacterium]
MRIRTILLALFMICIARELHPQYDPDFYDNYTVIPGQPASAVIGLFKESQGFIWASYISGIYRYDGTGMKHYKRIPEDTNSLSDNLVRSFLFEDSLNRIWVSNFSNNIDIINTKTGKIRQLSFDHSEFNFNNVAGLFGGCQDANGNIIGNAQDRILAYFDLGKKKLYSILIDPDHPDSSINKVTEVYKDRTGRIWIGTQSGLFIFNAADKSFIRPLITGDGSEALNNAFILEMIQDAEGTFWIGTGNGLFKFDTLENTISHYRHKPEDPNMLSHDVIRRLHEYPP